MLYSVPVDGPAFGRPDRRPKLGPDGENALGHPSRAFLFHLEPDKNTTLQSQLRRMLVSAILDGQVQPGSPLPSCRSLAQSLKIARNTVVLAYQRT